MDKTKILTVDDDSDMLLMLRLLFERAGAQVTCVSDALEAKELILNGLKNNIGYDMITIDIRMPKLDGYELCKELRVAGFHGAVVALTGTVTEEGLLRSQRYGITSYLDKREINKEIIKELLEEHCQ